MTRRMQERIWRLVNRGDYHQAGDYIARHVAPDELAKAIAYALQTLEDAIIGTFETDETD